MILRRTAEKAVERWGNRGAFSFRVENITYVIDPSQTLFVIQHDLSIRYGKVRNVFIGFGVLTISTTTGSLGFEVDDPS